MPVYMSLVQNVTVYLPSTDCFVFIKHRETCWISQICSIVHNSAWPSVMRQHASPICYSLINIRLRQALHMPV